MSGHTRCDEVRERRLRAMTPTQRARRRALLEQFRFEVWRLRVEERFVVAMAAAAAGEPVVWPTEPAQRAADARWDARASAWTETRHTYDTAAPTRLLLPPEDLAIARETATSSKG